MSVKKLCAALAMLVFAGQALSATAIPDPVLYAAQKQQKSGAKFTCEGKHKCAQMSSCDEAYFYLQQCGVGKLDRDKDGIPCESICGG